MTLASASPSFALLSPLFDEASLAVPRGGDLSGVGFAGWWFGELFVGALLVGVLVGGVSAGVALAIPGVMSAATMANARSFMIGLLVKSALDRCKWGTVSHPSDLRRLSLA